MKNKVIIPIISIVLIIPLFVVPVAAQTTNVQTTNHGTITYEVAASNSDAENIVLNFGLFSCTVAGKKVSTVTYELDNYYTGTITFQATGPFFGSSGGTNYNCELYLSNCTIVERNEDKLTVYIKEQRELAISIVRNNSGTININDWYQIYSETLTAAGSELNTLNGILAYCSFINDDTLDIAADVEAIRTYMGYSGVSDTVHTDLNAIKGFIEALGTKYDTMNGKITSIQSYVIHIDQVLGYINTTLNNINNTLINFSNYEIPAYSMFAYQTFKSLGFTIANNPSISYFPYFTTNTTNNDNAYTSSRTIRLNKGINYIALLTENRSGIYLNSNVKFYTAQGSQITQDLISYSGVSGSQVSALMLFTINVTANYDQIEMEFQGQYYIVPVFIGNQRYLPITVSNMIQRDTKDSYVQAINAVEDAVRSMSINVSNLTVNATGITYNVTNTEVNNSVTNYNTNINQVFNVENNLSTDFNTYNQQFNPDFTDTLQSIQVAPQVMNNILISLYDLPFIKYPTLITLAGIVLLALLGV